MIHLMDQTIEHTFLFYDDLEYELRTKGFNILSEPTSPMESIRVAMIEIDGAPVELMEFKMESELKNKLPSDLKTIAKYVPCRFL